MDYQRLDGAATRVYVIEVVVDMDEEFNMEDCLDYLRGQGAAEVVDSFVVTGSYDDNYTILRSRAK